MGIITHHLLTSEYRTRVTASFQAVKHAFEAACCALRWQNCFICQLMCCLLAPFSCHSTSIIINIYRRGYRLLWRTDGLWNVNTVWYRAIAYREFLSSFRCAYSAGYLNMYSEKRDATRVVAPAYHHRHLKRKGKTLKLFSMYFVNNIIIFNENYFMQTFWGFFLEFLIYFLEGF